MLPTRCITRLQPLRHIPLPRRLGPTPSLRRFRFPNIIELLGEQNFKPEPPTLAERLVNRLPPAAIPFAQLARLDKPIGSWLLFWPCGIASELDGVLMCRVEYYVGGCGVSCCHSADCWDAWTVWYWVCDYAWRGVYYQRSLGSRYR
jgi:hypothetical protein